MRQSVEQFIASMSRLSTSVAVMMVTVMTAMMVTTSTASRHPGQGFTVARASSDIISQKPKCKFLW